MTTTVIQMFLIGALSVGSLFFIIWIIHLFLKNAAVVDVGWGLGFVLLSAVYILLGEGFNLRNSIYFMMISSLIKTPFHFLWKNGML